MAVTYDANNGQVCFYLNGVLDARDATFAPAKFSDAHIGAWNNGRFFDGKLDELSIWRTVRTQSEIQVDCKSAIANPQTQPDCWHTIHLIKERPAVIMQG